VLLLGDGDEVSQAAKIHTVNVIERDMMLR